MNATMDNPNVQALIATQRIFQLYFGVDPASFQALASSVVNLSVEPGPQTKPDLHSSEQSDFSDSAEASVTRPIISVTGERLNQEAGSPVFSEFKPAKTLLDERTSRLFLKIKDRKRRTPKRRNVARSLRL